MMSKHTPGPWKAKTFKRKDGNNYTAIDGRITDDPNTAVLICEMAGWQGEARDEQKANANLIAAAPDMYAALKAIDDGDGSLTESEIVKQMRAAIEKAEGKK